MTKWAFENTKNGYLNLWKKAKISPEDEKQAERFANTIIKNEATYREIQNTTGVPWFAIGAFHMRESSCNFKTHLHNGDPLTDYTKHRPPGRPKIGHGPPFTFLESAIDALKVEGFTEFDWTANRIARILWSGEKYNGLGYEENGENDPYVWAGTNLQERGKYTSDGSYDHNAWDTQLGIAAVLLKLCQLRPDIDKWLNQEKTMTDAEGSIRSVGQVQTQPVTVHVPTQIPHFDVQQIQNLMATIGTILPIVSTFVPQLKIVTPFLPLATGLVGMISELQSGGDPLTVIENHLRQIADQVRQIKTS